MKGSEEKLNIMKASNIKVNKFKEMKNIGDSCALNERYIM